MNSDQLSKRLMRVGAHVKKGARLADIGSDHAYLPCFLAKQHHVEFAIAGEVVKGPFLSAERQIRSEGLSSVIEARLGNGLDVIRAEDQVTDITIAGMGGPLIASILDRGKVKTDLVERLILQPNIHAQAIREWAGTNGWKITAEEILEENQKIYEIVVLEKGHIELTEKQKMLGPFLMEENSPVFQKKWLREKTEWQSIVTKLPASDREEIQLKRRELETKIHLVEEVIGQ